MHTQGGYTVHMIRHREDESEDNGIEEENFDDGQDGILEEFQNFKINFDEKFDGFDTNFPVSQLCLCLYFVKKFSILLPLLIVMSQCLCYEYIYKRENH